MVMVISIYVICFYVLMHECTSLSCANQFQAPPPSKPVVVIQLASVESWWCEDIFHTVVNTILNSGASVTIGIIGQNLDSHEEFGSYLSHLSENEAVELASNSFEFRQYAGQSLLWQEQDMMNAQNMIESVTASTPSVIIVPIGTEIDSNTTTAMEGTGQLRILSARCIYINDTAVNCNEVIDVCVSSIKRGNIYALPVGAVLGNMSYWQDYTLPASLPHAVDWIENQIRRQGFGVIQMQPAEFSLQGNCTDLDPEKLSVLVELLNLGMSQWNFQRSSDAVRLLTASNFSVEPTVSPAPHPSPSPPPPTSLPTSNSLYTPQENIVMIRIDDVTVGWCEAMGVAAIDTVLEEAVPVNIGVIGNGLRQGEPLVAYLADRAKRSDVEIVSHSFQHAAYSSFPMAWQLNDLSLAQVSIGKHTGVRPSTFIPPQNLFTSDTFTAINRLSDIMIMSPECLWSVEYPGTPLHCPGDADVVAPNLKVNGVYMLPAGAVLGGEAYWTHYLLPASVDDAVQWVNQQLANQGFSVLMLHPVEFSTTSECVEVNYDKIQVLRDVIRYGISHGWTFMTFRDGTEALTGEKLSPITTVDPPVQSPHSNHEERNLLLNWPIWVLIPVLLLSSILLIPCMHIVFQKCTEEKADRSRQTRSARKSVSVEFEQIYPRQVQTATASEGRLDHARELTYSPITTGYV